MPENRDAPFPILAEKHYDAPSALTPENLLRSGAAFAVLIAEELFASSCRLLLSMTSTGQLQPCRPTPYFILIERALPTGG